MWHESYGIVKYDPPRPGMKRRTDWWAILMVDREITRYYRWWVKKRFWIDLDQPSWDAHISIVRGEKPRPGKTELWKKYQNEKISFRYSHEVKQVKNKPEFWFVEVEAPRLLEIRREFGLPADWPLHLTIGRTH